MLLLNCCILLKCQKKQQHEQKNTMLTSCICHRPSCSLNIRIGHWRAGTAQPQLQTPDRLVAFDANAYRGWTLTCDPSAWPPHKVRTCRGVKEELTEQRNKGKDSGDAVESRATGQRGVASACQTHCAALVTQFYSTGARGGTTTSDSKLDLRCLIVGRNSRYMAIKYHSIQHPSHFFFYLIWFVKVYFDDVKIGGKESKIIFFKNLNQERSMSWCPYFERSRNKCSLLNPAPSPWISCS